MALGPLESPDLFSATAFAVVCRQLSPCPRRDTRHPLLIVVTGLEPLKWKVLKGLDDLKGLFEPGDSVTEVSVFINYVQQ